VRGVTAEQVAAAVRRLLSAGEPSITVRRVRAITGGSLATISNCLKLPGVREGTFDRSSAAVQIAFKLNGEQKAAAKLLEPISKFPPSSFHASPRIDGVVADELFALTERFRKLQDEFDVLISDASRALAASRDRIQIYARKVEFMETERKRLLGENREMREALHFLHTADVNNDRKDDD
jgi:hypothetical protein